MYIALNDPKLKSANLTGTVTYMCILQSVYFYDQTFSIYKSVCTRVSKIGNALNNLKLIINS